MAILLVARRCVFPRAFVRMNPDNDYLFDRVHLIEHGENVVRSPSVAGKRLLFEKQILSVVHIEHGVFLERILVIPGWQKDAESVRISRGAGEWLHQLAD